MKGQTAGRREGLAAGARQRGGIARTVGRREKGGREGKRSGRPPGGRPPSPGGTGWQRTRVLPRGFPSPGGSAVPGAAPRGGGGCGRSAALPGLPLGSRPAPFPRPGKRLHFPALPSSERALRGSLAGSRHLLPSQGARRGGARQPRPRSPPSPPPPFPRAGAEPAAHGGGSRGGTRRRRLSGAAGSAMRAAACLLSLALCALPAAPGEPRPRGSAAALGAGGAVGMDGVVVGDAAPRAAAEPRGNGAPAPACAPAARGAAG